MVTETAERNAMGLVKEKFAAYVAFTKFRLTALVVISSVIGYGIGTTHFSWVQVFWLCISGYLVTGASNGFNQVIEREIDVLMKRTQNRPLPTGKMSVPESIILASILGFVGLFILYVQFNTLAAVLGFLALFTYVAIYTPMKKHSSWAVFAGAFPGAIPPMLGYVAATGAFDLYAGLLFAVQFVWQFPHFWAIAWVSHEDYQRAGYKLLPSRGEKDAQSAFLILLYTLFLIPVAILPWAFDLIGLYTAIAAALAGILFAIPALRFYFNRKDKLAKTVMFASFFYLPAIQLIYLIGK
jgi:protoheme IX farnesyltransferase